jgi:hypothetical protein
MSYPIGTAAHAIEIAKGEIGVVEEGNNLTKYGEFTKANGLPWCGSFCNWILAQANVKVHSVVATAVGAHKFKEISRWNEMPELGDLAFMDFPHDGVDRISHVGIVVGIDGKTITTIEGNTSGNGDQRNGGMCVQKTRGYEKNNKKKLLNAVVGWGRPVYVGEENAPLLSKAGIVTAPVTAPAAPVAAKPAVKKVASKPAVKAKK